VGGALPRNTPRNNGSNPAYTGSNAGSSRSPSDSLLPNPPGLGVLGQSRSSSDSLLPNPPGLDVLGQSSGSSISLLPNPNRYSSSSSNVTNSNSGKSTSDVLELSEQIKNVKLTNIRSEYSTRVSQPVNANANTANYPQLLNIIQSDASNAANPVISNSTVSSTSSQQSNVTPVAPSTVASTGTSINSARTYSAILSSGIKKGKETVVVRKGEYTTQKLVDEFLKDKTNLLEEFLKLSESKTQKTTKLTENLPQLTGEDKKILNNIENDSVTMKSQGIDGRIVQYIGCLRYKIAQLFESNGFSRKNPIKLVDQNSSRPFATEFPNGIGAISQDTQGESGINDLSKLIYKFIMSCGGNITLLNAFFLCHSNIDSGSWGPLGCLMKAFIGEISGETTSPWKKFGIAGKRYKGKNEVSDFLSSQKENQNFKCVINMINKACGCKDENSTSIANNNMPANETLVRNVMCENFNSMGNIFLPMWAATIEMLARIEFPGNSLANRTCEAYRMETFDNGNEFPTTGKYSHENQSSTVSFSLATVFFAVNLRVTLRSSIPHWKIIFPFFMKLHESATRFARKNSLGYAFGPTQNEIVAFSNGIEVKKIGYYIRNNINSHKGKTYDPDYNEQSFGFVAKIVTNCGEKPLPDVLKKNAIVKDECTRIISVPHPRVSPSDNNKLIVLMKELYDNVISKSTGNEITKIHELCEEFDFWNLPKGISQSGISEVDSLKKIFEKMEVVTKTFKQDVFDTFRGSYVEILKFLVGV
jgi:hypothetical protein